MTAKEFLRKKNKQNKVYGMIGGSSPLEQSITSTMNEYARIIAEKAIHEVSNEYTFSTTFEARAVTLFGNKILSRIKQLTEVV